MANQKLKANKITDRAKITVTTLGVPMVFVVLLAVVIYTPHFLSIINFFMEQ